MAAYALAQMRHVTIGPPIEECIRRIDATLAPFGGRFIVRGAPHEVLEGSWNPTRLVVIEFPSLKAAQDCYHSPEYTAARAIRRKFADAEMVLVEGVFD